LHQALSESLAEYRVLARHGRLFPLLLAVAATFSGVALVVHIVSGLSLRLALAGTTALMLLAIVAVWRLADPARRRRIRRVAAMGATAGVLALLAYDLSKWLLSRLDPSPYNPFEAIRAFGMLLVGTGARADVVLAAGTAFHAVNGICFGIAFAFLFGGRGVLAGIGWGLFLELFQLLLYPGWLSPAFFKEFVQISGLAHVVYGASLGLLCRRLLPASGSGLWTDSSRR
jgi:hypothetical protein